MSKTSYYHWYHHWYHSYSLRKIFLLQKRAIRNLFCIKRVSKYVKGHTKAIFANFNILNVYNVYIYMTTLHLAKLIICKEPEHLYNVLRLDTSSETRNSRIYQPNLSLKHYMNNFCYQGPKVWNHLSSSPSHSENIVSSPSLTCLKARLKRFLIKMQMHGDENHWLTSNFNVSEYLTISKSDLVLTK